MQSRITDFLTGPASLQLETTREAARPRVTLMDLPEDVRRRIYRYVGLLPNGCSRSIHLSKTSTFDKRCLFESIDPQHDRRNGGRIHTVGHRVEEFSNCHRCPPNSWSDYDGPFSLFSNEILPTECLLFRGHRGEEFHCCKVPTSLFRVCRAWSEDATRMFYSENEFKVFHRPGEGLAVLDSLRPSVLRAMRRLTVRLSMSFCGFASMGEDCGLENHHWECHPDCKVIGHDAPLEPKQQRYKQVARDWERLCQRLSVAIDPGELNLTLIANAGGVDVAAALVEPMRLLPTLRACSISLSKWHNPDIRSISEEACLRAMGYPESRFRDPFPFRKLPDEIQLEVLRHAGLRAPYHLWCDRFKPGSTSYRDSGISAQCIYEPDVVENDGCVMCCTGDHAHSAANPTCSCWTLSMAPLAVDHKMRRMAQSILYQENTWVLDLGDFDKMSGYYDTYFDDLLRLARHLQIRVSTSDVGQPYYVPGQRWHSLIERLSRLHYDPTQLTMSLVMLHPQHHRYEPVGPLVFQADSEADGAVEWSGHRCFSSRAYSSLQSHQFHPKDLFVRILRRHHIHGVGDAFWQAATMGESPTCDQQDFGAQETEIERHILGDALYDAAARGKSKAIHEMVDDRPKDHSLRECLNVWEPFAHEAACTQCGHFSNNQCAGRM